MPFPVIMSLLVLPDSELDEFFSSSNFDLSFESRLRLELVAFFSSFVETSGKKIGHFLDDVTSQSELTAKLGT